MQSPGREPSMEDILASIKKVIAEEKELRTAVTAAAGRGRGASGGRDGEDDVLELERTSCSACRPRPTADRRAMPPGIAARRSSSLQTVAATVPAGCQVNPLEEMVREMLRPMLKQWLDEHLPQIVDEHVKREISRITGRPL